MDKLYEIALAMRDAKQAINDAGVFSVDQIALLEYMLDAIEEAIGVDDD